MHDASISFEYCFAFKFTDNIHNMKPAQCAQDSMRVFVLNNLRWPKLNYIHVYTGSPNEVLIPFY